MSIAYSEFVDFIVSGHSPSEIIAFEPSAKAKERVALLISQEKTTGLSRDEAAELDHYMHIEHIMRLAKARAQQQLTK